MKVINTSEKCTGTIPWFVKSRSSVMDKSSTYPLCIMDPDNADVIIDDPLLIKKKNLPHIGQIWEKVIAQIKRTYLNKLKISQQCHHLQMLSEQ